MNVMAIILNPLITPKFIHSDPVTGVKAEGSYNGGKFSDRQIW